MKPESRYADYSPRPGAGALFTDRYASWTAEQMLAHQRKRTDVHYFPVVDPGETRRDIIDGIVDNRFDLNHEAHRLGDPIAWLENPSDDLEWQILLHKFYFSVGLGIAFHETRDRLYLRTWIKLTSSWIDTVQPDFLRGDSPLNDGLFVAVTGRRIQNWIYAHYYFVTHQGADDLPASFHQRLLESICLQVNHLTRHIAPARNHRTIDLYAIFLAAVVFPEFSDSARWLETSSLALFDNMRTDLLPDGVQCELSTDYHHLVLRNFLCVRKLAKINGIAVPEDVDALLRRALDFSLHVHKPDGEVPSLSDGDVHSYLDLLALGDWLYGDPVLRYGATLGREGIPPVKRSAAYPASGYCTLRSGWGQREPYTDERYLVFDCGPLGEGNHGHLDLLNIEVAGFGRSLVVDPGRYTYSEAGDTNWRVRFRSTAYHNTVTVDERNQTAYLPGRRKFKIKGPAPEHELRSFDSGYDVDYLHGIARSHEYDAVHERKILFAVPDYWIVEDRLKAEQIHGYDLRFHLGAEDHGQTKEFLAAGTRIVQAPQLLLAQCNEPDTASSIEDGYVSRRYGERQAAPVVRYHRRARDSTFTTLLYPYRGAPPTIQMRSLAESGGGSLSAAAVAFELTIDDAGRHVKDLLFLAPERSARPWRFGDIAFDGDYFWLRATADGTVRRLQTSDGATLELAGRPVRIGDALR